MSHNRAKIALPQHELLTLLNLPAGTTVRAVQANIDPPTVYVVIEHPNLPETEPDAESPYLHPTRHGRGYRWPFGDTDDTCPNHRGPEGPNEDLSQCPRCLAPTWTRRPTGEQFGNHLPDCSLPRDHTSWCQPGGAGHPAPDVLRG